MKKIIVACLMLVAISSNSQTLKLNEKFINAINQVEAGGRHTGSIIGDGGKAIGPFQLHRDYWIDATKFDKTIGGSYSQCADYNYSKRIVAAYLTRYGAKYIKSNDFESLARIHNGGPNGYRYKGTISYWHKVQAWMAK